MRVYMYVCMHVCMYACMLRGKLSVIYIMEAEIKATENKKYSKILTVDSTRF